MDDLTQTMLVALKVLYYFGKRDFACIAPKSTVRALFKRGIIDSALTIKDFAWKHQINCKIKGD